MRTFPSRSWIGLVAGIGALLALFVAVPISAVQAKPDIASLDTQEIEVSALALDQFNRADGSETRFGKLIWRGGLSLTSRSPYFGGISGIVLDRNGEQFLAISDAGLWIGGRIAYRGDQPANLVGVAIGPIKGLSGKSLTRNRDRDCEAIVSTGGYLGEGTLLTSYERNSRIGRHKIVDGGLGKTIELLTLPKGAKQLRGNGGLEAIAVLQAGPDKGKIVAFSEKRTDSDGNQLGWLIAGKRSRPLKLRNDGGFQVTDAAALPDGGILVLWRSFSWTTGVRMRLERIGVEALQSTGVIAGELLMAADGAHAIDNMEAVAVSVDEAGDQVITLVSDDNYSVLQRTLLLQFTLPAKTETAGE